MELTNQSQKQSSPPDQELQLASRTEAPTIEDNVEFAYPKGYQLVVITVSLVMCVFLLGLDATIIATAIPKITDEFSSVADIGWYGSAFRLASCISQLVQGRLFNSFSVKWIFLIHLVFFEAGTLLSGAAPSSSAFIVGRAVSGFGFSGISQGCMVIIALTRPLEQRPIYTGVIAASEFFATAVAPIIGGAITSALSWRWCFYINVILAVAPAAVILVMLRLPDGGRSVEANNNRLQRIKELDFVGMTLFAAAVLCLLLALEWSGHKYNWSNERIIVLLILSLVLLVAFSLIQLKRKEHAMLPLRILGQRSILFAALYSLALQAVNGIISYYIPMWFQVVKGATPLESGIKILPNVVAILISSVLAGFAISYLRNYFVVMIPAGLVAVGGAIMMVFVDEQTTMSYWIPTLALLGIGIGAGISGPFIAAQTVLKHGDVSIGLALMTFSQEFGAGLFLSIGQCIFLNKLRQCATRLTPDLDPDSIIAAGATSLDKSGLGEYASKIALEYSESLKTTFYLTVSTAACVVLTGVFVERKAIQ